MLKGIAVEDVFWLRTVSNMTLPPDEWRPVRTVVVCAIQVALSTVHAAERLSPRTRGIHPAPIAHTGLATHI